MKRITSALSLLLVLCVTSFANAALLIDFKPEPTNELPEIIFAGGGPAVPMLREGPGAVGNGDSGLPPHQQTAGGLTVEIPYAIPGIPGGTVNAAGTTTIRDVTLRLTGLAQSGVADVGSNVTSQELTAGTFQLIAGHGLGAPSVLIVAGDIADARIVRLNDGDVGAVLSDSVTYSGAPGGLLPNVAGLTGTLAFSLANITDLAIVAPGVIGDFTADATGQFTIVPEPAAAVAAVVICVPALLRRRRRVTARSRSTI
jgi:hypothetical protein